MHPLETCVCNFLRAPSSVTFKQLNILSLSSAIKDSYPIPPSHPQAKEYLTTVFKFSLNLNFFLILRLESIVNISKISKDWIRMPFPYVFRKKAHDKNENFENKSGGFI